MNVKRLICLLLASLLTVCVLPFSASAEEISPSEDSDFTILWVSDPQWYSFKYQSILEAQNDWVVENYERMNMQYIIHTGDFVDLPHERKQWESVDPQYKKWDDAGLAYGVLAGNHDVDGSDYTEFKEYFGTQRFENNPWYGDSYDGNRGHYDLLTLGGVDFIFVYLGYGTHSEQDYEWMNGVLDKHSDRIAFIMFHEYLNADGSKTAIGEQIFNRVVLKNPNVRAVLCGHNYNSARLVEYIDDDGDGKEDRTVYQLMANYQNTPNGGNGFMRFLECDVDGGKIIQRTYSPYLKEFNAFENRGDDMDQFGYRDEFTIPFDFSKPAARDESTHESGKVISKPTVFINETPFDVDGLNVYVKDERIGAVGIYDSSFSLDARDALSTPDKAKYITAEYTDRIGWTVCGIFNDGSKRVSIPQNGVAIVFPETATDSDGNAFDLDTVKTGDRIIFSQINVVSNIKNATHITIRLKGLYGKFAIEKANAKPDNGEWTVLDRNCEPEALNACINDKKNCIFVFSPTKNERYAVTANELVALNDIPEKGFALVINTAGTLNSFSKSLNVFFKIGREALIYGYAPESGLVYRGESIISKLPEEWNVKSDTIKLEATEDGLVMWNTDGLWPDAVYVYDEPLTIDPKEGSLYYDIFMEQGSQASFVIQLSNGNYFKLNSYFESALISSGSGDIKGQGKSHTGTLELSTLELDSKCLNKDGTLSVKSIQIYASGDAGKKMTIKELRIIDERDNNDVVPEDFLVTEEDEISDGGDASVEASDEESDNRTAMSGSNDTVWALIAIGIAVIAVIAAAVTLFVRKRNG